MAAPADKPIPTLDAERAFQSGLQADRAEEALLGAALIDPRWIAQARDLRPEDFRSPMRSAAWRAILAGADDPLTLEHELRRAGHLRADVAIFLDWCDRCPTAHGALNWARMVRDAARRRRFRMLLQRAFVLLESEVPTEEVIGVLHEAMET